MNKAIVIVGDGAMGTVCTKLLAGKGHPLRLWTAFEENARQMAAGHVSKFLPEIPLAADLEITADPARALSDVCLVVSAVPCQFMRSVWGRLKEHFPAGTPVCSVTKGIENQTLLRPTQILADVLYGSANGGQALAALSGPSIAHEVAQELPATVVAACRDQVLGGEIQRLFNTPYFRVYTNSDLVGVELAGATKNVIAIAAGILDGMKAGDNAKAALLSRGLVEITRLGVALGGQRDTFFGLAGTGDLVTTCVSPFGRNRSFGEAIGRGQSIADALHITKGVVEGVATTQSVLGLAERHNVLMPITRAVHAVVFGNQPPAKAISDLMSRRLKAEYE